ncbi:MAG: hypothetical protein WBP13_09740 [Methylophilaceae bacterium]
MKQFNIIALLISLLTALPASAHYMWLEQVDGQTKLYFGEYENALHEKTGGRLDALASPEAQINLNKLDIQRKEDYLLLETDKHQTVVNQVIVAHELTMKVKDLRKYNIGIVKPMYYARIGEDRQVATLPVGLNVQSIGDHKVRVSLDGKPLPKGKLHIYAPNQWGQELDLNEAGEVSFVTPWKGLYVLEAVHLQPSNGNYQGDAYEAIRHVSTLSIVQP